MIAPPAGVTLEVRHRTIYDYGAPVSLAQHQAHLRPLSDPTQTLLEHHLEIVPRPVFVRDSVDAMGNTQVHFGLAEPHTELRVTASSLVRVSARFQGLRPEEGPAWEPLAESLGPPDDLAQSATVINRAMERLIMRGPQQYLWGYHRYKQPRDL